jgi:c-di-GMP-binding flagellar brake protein YcgR
MPTRIGVRRTATGTHMSLTFRPDMKAIVHEVDGDPVTVIGKTIDGSSSALVAMMDAANDVDRLRSGATVRCSYVDPTGVHEFVSTVVAADGLALNHRLVRLTIAGPTESQRKQRREHVRVCVELPVGVHLPDGSFVACTSVDLSAGGIAVTWPDATDLVEVAEMVEVQFRSDRFEHHHQAMVVGSYVKGKLTVARMRFEGISDAGRDRLASVVFAAQRFELKRQRD